MSLRAPAVIRGSENYPQPSPRPVVTIGNFDGVHQGHRQLLELVQKIASELNRPTAVYTFDPAPRDVLRPDNNIPRIQTLDDKLAKLHATGIDHVVVERFSLEFAKNEAKWFATEVIGRRLGASALVVGWDFHFGRNRSGNFDDLTSWLDFPVHRFDAFKLNDRVVSSSRIREAVRAGQLSEANALLEHEHQVVGHVSRGDGRGRKLGFPTANISPLTSLIPADGVYAVWLERSNGQRHLGVANIGTRPTFNLHERTIEVHLWDFNDDLYGEFVRVGWVDRIRGEQRFASTSDLIERIKLDNLTARNIFEARAT